MYVNAVIDILVKAEKYVVFNEKMIVLFIMQSMECCNEKYLHYLHIKLVSSGQCFSLCGYFVSMANKCKTNLG
jgi:hypothetical protein